MANSYVQYLVMPLITVTRTGKLGHVQIMVPMSMSEECMLKDQLTCHRGFCVTCLKTAVQHKFWSLILPLFLGL